MELRQLAYFREAAETLSFAEAARRCHVTASTLGQQIRQVEAELGRPLFDRTPAGLALTESGERLLVSARRVLAEVERGVSDIKAPRARTPLRLGYYGNALAPHLGRILSLLRQRHPDVWLEISELGQDELADGVLDGRLDCALTVHDPTRHDRAELAWERVHTCPYLAVVKEGALDRPPGSTVSVAEVPGPVVTLSKIQSARLSSSLGADDPGAEQPVYTPSNSHRALMLLVASGQCSALTPEDTWTGAPCTVAYRLSDLGLTFSTCLVWRAGTGGASGGVGGARGAGVGGARGVGQANPAVGALRNACRDYFAGQAQEG